MPGAFLWDDRVAGAAAIAAAAGTPVATMPMSNLTDPQPRLRARLLGSAASLLVDLGAATGIDAAALVSTTLGPAATVRWRVGAGEALIEAAPLFDLRYDTGAIAPPAGWTFARASSGFYFDATRTLTQAASNAPRYDYDPATGACLGLLMEEQRTNGIRNPRAEGATVGTIGSGGVAPTNWTVANNTPGVSGQIVGTGTEAGIPYVDVRFFGTTTATGSLSVFPEQTFGVPALTGQTWTFSAAVRLVAGSMNGLNNAAVLCWNEYDASATNAVKFSVVNGSIAAKIASAPTLAQARQSGTLTLSGGAATAYLQPRIFFNSVSQGVALDCTFRIGIPQLEQGAVMSSPILPPAGSPSASTRAADRQAVTGLAINGTAGFSLLVDFTGAVGGSGIIVPAGLVPASGAFPDSTYLTQSPTYSNVGLTILDSVHGNYPVQPGLSQTEGTACRVVATAGPAGVVFARNSGMAAPVATVPTFAGTLTTLSIGGAPWGGSPGTAGGVSRYRRFALYAMQLTAGQAAALAATGSSLDAGALAYDSGTAAAATGDDAGGNIVLLAPATASGRYLQVDVADPSAAFIDIGRLVAGPVWRVSRAFAYGIQEGRLMLDRRDRNPLTGAEFPVPALANPRVARFTLPLLAAAEIAGQHRSMLRAMGAAGDALWIPETTLSRAELNARSLWGAVAEAGAEALATRDSFPGSSRSFRIVERV